MTNALLKVKKMKDTRQVAAVDTFSASSENTHGSHATVTATKKTLDGPGDDAVCLSLLCVCVFDAPQDDRGGQQARQGPGGEEAALHGDE